MTSITWHIFETTGILAFAFSGAMVGISKRMDIFGITVLSVLTAVGGGMIRDILAGVIPPTVLRDSSGLIISVMTALIVFTGYEWIPLSPVKKKRLAIFYHVFDTIGLAAFTMTGVITARYLYPEYTVTLPVMLGLITAVGGGVMRDIMAQKIPVVLKMDVYALASLLGGLMACFSWPWVGPVASSWIGFFTVLLLRTCAILFSWQLPRPHLRRYTHFD